MTDSEFNRIKRACENGAPVRLRIKPREAGEIIRQMADAIVDAATLNGNCTEADLHATGRFTSAEIIEYAADARALARNRMRDRDIARERVPA